MSKLALGIRQATSKSKKTTSKKAAKRAVLKSKPAKAPKTKALAPEFISKAEKELDGIIKDKNSLGQDYFAMLDRCKKFGEEKLYRGVKDEHGSYFKTFRASMKYVFGKSASTMFKDISVAQKLLPVIGKADLLKISKENREHITELPNTLQGETKVIEAAKILTNAEFEAKFPVKKQTPEVKKANKERSKVALEYIVRVSPSLLETLLRIEKLALQIENPQITDGDYSDTLKAKAVEAIFVFYEQNRQGEVPEAWGTGTEG